MYSPKMSTFMCTSQGVTLSLTTCPCVSNPVPTAKMRLA